MLGPSEAGATGFITTIMFESTSMPRHTLPLAIFFGVSAVPAAAQAPQVSTPQVSTAQVSAPQVYTQQYEPQSQAQVRYAAAPRREMGGGFLEFLFNGTGEPPRQYRQAPRYEVPQYIDPRAGQPYERDLAPRGSVMG